MKLLKVINKNKTYVGKDGKERFDVCYYLCFDLNGAPKYLAVDPHFKDSKRDWFLLDAVAERRIIEATTENDAK